MAVRSVNQKFLIVFPLARKLVVSLVGKLVVPLVVPLVAPLVVAPDPLVTTNATQP